MLPAIRRAAYFQCLPEAGSRLGIPAAVKLLPIWETPLAVLTKAHRMRGQLGFGRYR
jgi:hypothetical protein